MEPMYLFKVGKKEHLELLKNGIVHFTPLSYFRGEGTAFRGDVLEGSYIIDVSKGLFVNGIDISKFGSGFRATYTYENSDDILNFSAAMLGQKNFKEYSDRIELDKHFFNEMRQFGQYAIIFDLLQFVDNIKAALSDTQCNSVWGKVTYCDKNDHAHMRECVRNIEEQYAPFTIYFVKDEKYQLQNEWRIIIDLIETSSVLKKNDDGSLDLKIKPVATSNIIDLNTAKD